MGIRLRLSAMMAVAYAVQGAWWPILSVHLADLGIDQRGRGFIFATLAMAALVSPSIAGRIADRSLSAQKLLSLLFGCGAAILAALTTGRFRTFGQLFPVFLLYWLLIIPYLNLTNTIAMRNLANRKEQFGSVRLWGTVSWMAVGWFVALAMRLGDGGTSTAFAVACALSVAMVVLGLTLPDTPPLASTSRGFPLREARQFLGEPGVVVLLTAGFLVSLTTPFIYQSVPLYLRHVGLDRPQVTAAMSLGQIPEILCLAILPRVIDRLGRKTTLLLGIASWAAYHGLLTSTPRLPWALAAIPMNGFAIAFFHVAGPMYLDSRAPSDHRAGVQGLWVMTTSGVGSLFGGLLAGEVMQRSGDQWGWIFAVPMLLASMAFLVVLVGFRTTAARHAPAPIGGFPALQSGAVSLE